MISLEAHFDSATLDRGRTYQRAGHVVSVAPEKDGGLEARVHNGKGTTYRQAIQIKPGTARKPNGEVLGLCSCPVSFNCKHVVAALMEYNAQGRKPGRSITATATVPAAVHHWLRQVQDSPAFVTQDAAPAPQERPEDYPETIKDRLLYITDFTQGELRIDIYKGRINAQGTGLNKAIRRYDVIYQLRSAKALPGFFRPVDLVLLSRLARSRRLTGQPSYASYDLPDVLRATDELDPSLLAEICHTGRALAEASPEAQLAWSDEIIPLDLGWNLGDDGGSRLAFVTPDGSALHVARFGQSGNWLHPTRKTFGELAEVPAVELIRLVRSCPVIARDDLARLESALPKGSRECRLLYEGLPVRCGFCHPLNNTCASPCVCP